MDLSPRAMRKGPAIGAGVLFILYSIYQFGVMIDTIGIHIEYTDNEGISGAYHTMFILCSFLMFIAYILMSVGTLRKKKDGAMGTALVFYLLGELGPHVINYVNYPSYAGEGFEALFLHLYNLALGLLFAGIFYCYGRKKPKLSSVFTGCGMFIIALGNCIGLLQALSISASLSFIPRAMLFTAFLLTGIAFMPRRAASATHYYA